MYKVNHLLTTYRIEHTIIIVFFFFLLVAAYPFSTKLMQYFEEESAKKVHTAAVCVYPSRVKDAYEKLSSLNKLNEINIAAGNLRNSTFFTFE